MSSDKDSHMGTDVYWGMLLVIPIYFLLWCQSSDLDKLELQMYEIRLQLKQEEPEVDWNIGSGKIREAVNRSNEEWLSR